MVKITVEQDGKTQTVELTAYVLVGETETGELVIASDSTPAWTSMAAHLLSALVTDYLKLTLVNAEEEAAAGGEH